jgi:glycosyltransferase involved in cell wall biosynthesis
MYLKICVVASYFYPRGYGGNAVYELCMQLVKRGLEVNLVTSSIKGEANFQSLNGINIYRMPTCFLKLFNTEYPFSPTAATDILKIASKNSDIIHANFEIFQTTLASTIVKNFLMKPMVLTMHGQGRNSSASYGSPMLNFGYSVNHNSLERIAVRSANRIIALTNAVKAKALKLGANSEKISVIPNGVNTEHFRPFHPDQKYYEELKIPRGNKVITFVGRLHPTHGTELLLAAILLILKIHPCSTFLIVGDGPLMSNVLLFVKSCHLENEVKVLGYRHDTAELLNMADVVVYPALSVGMPLTILEAMACGKAVVAFNLEGNRELIVNGKTGFFAEQTTAESLASCTISALNNLSSTEKIGENGRYFVCNNFTWKKTSEKVVAVYKELLSKESQS